MRMFFAIAVAITMMSTHGYGLFLFGAIVPTLQSDYGFGYSFVGWASATIQIAYMVGAFLIGSLGRLFSPSVWLLASTLVCIVMLQLLSLTTDRPAIVAMFGVLGAASAMSWGGAVGTINQILPSDRRGLVLTVGASGGAWGMLTIGMATGYGMDFLDMLDLWSVGAVIGCLGFALLIAAFLTPSLRNSNETTTDNSSDPEQSNQNSFAEILFTRPAVLVIILSGMLGMTAVPFTTYLNAYLVEEMGRSVATASSVWQVLGITGAVSGFVIGQLADRMDHRRIMHITFALFAGGCFFMATVPMSSLIGAAGIGHGIVLNPFWGLAAAYIGLWFSSLNTMRIASFGLTAFGFCGAVANWIIGQWAATGGSFASVYLGLCVIVLAMSALLLIAPSANSQQTEALQ